MSETIPTGTTVHLEARPYNIAVMELPANTHWIGVPGTIFNGTNVNHGTAAAPDWWGLHITNDNISIEGVAMNGFDIKIDKPAGGINTNIVLKNNTMVNGGFRSTQGLQNATLTGNSFTGTISFGFGESYEGQWINVTHQNNVYINIGAGAHIWPQPGSKNILVQQNYFSQIRGGMGIEFGTPNGGCNGITFQDMWYDPPNQGTTPYNQLLNFMAYSLVCPGSTNVVVQRLICIDDSASKGHVPVKIGIETAGNGYVASDCIIMGTEWAATFADGTTPSNINIHNMQFSGATNGLNIRQDHPATGRVFTSSNIAADQSKLSDLMKWRFANKDKPTTTHNSATTIPTPPPIMNFTVTTTSGGIATDPQITFSTPANIPVGAVKYRLNTRATGDHAVVEPIAGPTEVFTTFPHTSHLFHPGWQVDVQITPVDSAGHDLASTGWITVPATGVLVGVSTTTPWPPVVTPPPTQTYKVSNGVLTMNQNGTGTLTGTFTKQ